MTDTSKQILAENNPYNDMGSSYETDLDPADAFKDLADEVIKDPETDTPNEPLTNEEEADEEAPNQEEDADSPETDNDNANDEELDGETEVTLQIDGEDTPVKLSELTSGYLRQQDYTKKTQAVAEQRKELETQLAHTKETLLKYAHEAQKIVNEYDAYNQADWDNLAQTDSPAYAQHDMRLKKAQTDLANLNSDYRQNETYQELRAKEVFQDKAKYAVRTLNDTVPDWNDEKYEAALAFAKAEGVDDAITQSTDPHLIRLLHEVLNTRNAKAIIADKIKVKRVVKSVKGTQLDHNQKAKTQSVNPYNDDIDPWLNF